jgi:hypothetical protein
MKRADLQVRLPKYASTYSLQQRTYNHWNSGLHIPPPKKKLNSGTKNQISRALIFPCPIYFVLDFYPSHHHQTQRLVLLDCSTQCFNSESVLQFFVTSTPSSATFHCILLKSFDKYAFLHSLQRMESIHMILNYFV